VVTVAEGEKGARILQAEAEKQARILQAEGTREAQIREAEGQREAAILEAEGHARALERVQEVARTLGSNTMSLQYLDVLPLELTSLLAPLARQTSEVGHNGTGS
jgi:regulator of protease activity HflC (stomatin/prohibitin superfamily)